MSNKKMTMGLIVGNRGFFPDHLAKSGREDMLRVLERAGMDCVSLTPEQSKYGAVETRDEAKSMRGPLPGEPRQASTASSSRCPTSATSAPSPKRCAWPA